MYGVPDERLGEELAVTLHTRVPLSESDLRAFLEPRLAKFEIPRYFHFEQTPLPRIASGKILKRQLREEAAARLQLLRDHGPAAGAFTFRQAFSPTGEALPGLAA